MEQLPRIAHTFWSGRECPWLYREGPKTLMRHLPSGWAHRHHDGGPVRHGPDAVWDSDVYRWRQLYRHGGIWADMDILFYANPLECLRGPPTGTEFWLTTDGHPEQPYSIGLMAALPGSEIVKAILDAALETDPDGGDYQRAGIRLMLQLWGLTPPAGVGRVPHRSFYCSPPTQANMARLWRREWDGVLPSHGLHWYGGHPDARPSGAGIAHTPVGKAHAKAMANGR